jgi:TolB protein
LLRSPRWSPDGEKIAFVSTDGKKSASDYFDNLWLINSDGSDKLQITYDMGVSVPFWSANSQWIAFSGTKFYEESDPLTDLWIFKVTDSELQRLTSNYIEGVNDLFMGWSPDCSQIMFIKQEYLPEDSTIYLMSLYSGEQTLVSKITRDFQIIP